jgi:hypothetical protein
MIGKVGQHGAQVRLKDRPFCSAGCSRGVGESGPASAMGRCAGCSAALFAGCRFQAGYTILLYTTLLAVQQTYFQRITPVHGRAKAPVLVC